MDGQIDWTLTNKYYSGSTKNTWKASGQHGQGCIEIIQNGARISRPYTTIKKMGTCLHVFLLSTFWISNVDNPLTNSILSVDMIAIALLVQMIIHIPLRFGYVT